MRGTNACLRCVLPGGQSAPQPMSLCLCARVSSILCWLAGAALSPAARRTPVSSLARYNWCLLSFRQDIEFCITSPALCALFSVCTHALVWLSNLLTFSFFHTTPSPSFFLSHSAVTDRAGGPSLPDSCRDDHKRHKDFNLINDQHQ